MSLQMHSEAPAVSAAPVAVPSNNGSTTKIVYTVVERHPHKSFWTRIGAAFVNRDGSLTVKLDAVPINGTMQIRDWTPREDTRPAGSSSSFASAKPSSGGFASASNADIPF